MATGPDYCTLGQVQSVLYAGRGLAPGDPPPTDATRDARLSALITQTSRDFDHEVAGPRYSGLFVPKYEQRIFSGRGEQVLDIDPALAVLRVEYNSTPGSTPTWNDITSELGTYRMGLLPSDTHVVKHQIFRQASWPADPFPLGNVRLSIVWGVCLVDPSAAVPTTPWAYGPGLTQAQINSLAPPGGGWWATPEDVIDAVTQWVVVKFESGKAGYSEQPGPGSIPGTQTTEYPPGIPQDVARVIQRYRGEDDDYPKLALVGNEPSSTPAPYRWRDWMTTT